MKICEHRPLHGYVLGVVLGTLLCAQVWGDDDPATDQSPSLDKGYPEFDIGFKAPSQANSYILYPCVRPCLTGASTISQAGTDQPLRYEQEFRLSLGQSGPFSFRLSGRRLKMEVAF